MIKVFHMNTSINPFELYKGEWKQTLLTAIRTEHPDVCLLVENFGYHYGYICKYITLPLATLVQNAPYLSGLHKLLLVSAAGAGWVMLKGLKCIKPFKFSCYTDYIKDLAGEYDIFCPEVSIPDYNYTTVLDSGLFILIRKNSNLTVLPNSFTSQQYSVNNKADQQVISIKVRTADGQIINVMTTHLICPSLLFTVGQNRTQMNELKEFIKKTVAPNERLLLSSDTNVNFRDPIDRRFLNEYCASLKIKKQDGDAITCIYDNTGMLSKSKTIMCD